MSTYIISDTHFLHDKDFMYAPRGFSDIKTHDETIIRNWNEIVGSDDDVYMLGDFCMEKNYKAMLETIGRLNGRIHIAIGNHDSDNKVETYLKSTNVVEAALAYRLSFKKRILYLSHYPTLTANYDDSMGKIVYNIHGHIHSPERFTEGHPYMYNASCDALGCRPKLLEDVVMEIRDNVKTYRIAMGIDTYNANQKN
ncbi:MAG: metallophosphoesterase family protein [Lachnospiraceae bacterium]|nr:metallophosphoesterase family protein [Lachnospiraceae bacterium]